MTHSDGPGDRGVVDVGFVLVPGFALMSFAAATEPFRAANLIARRELWRVRYFGETRTVASSSGVPVPAEPLPPRGAGLAAVFVIAGGGPADWDRPALLHGLRRLAGEGVRLGGISGGPYLLAAAGLLAGRRFTIHWEHAPALAEAFPELSPVQARYVIDRDRLTCGGGIAPLDMMHALIADRLGEAFARRVADWFLHTEVGAGGDPQRASVAERHGVHHPVLVAVLSKMEATVEAPLSRAAMARFAGVSPRHLDRLFAGHRGTTFRDDYRRIRLAHADRLVRQSALAISEIAFAAGFASPAHFARAYAAAYGRSPSAARRVSSGLRDVSPQ